MTRPMRQDESPNSRSRGIDGESGGKDLQTNAPALRITTGKDFLYVAQPYGGDLYILTNEDGPHFRVFKTPVTAPAREHWREIIPQSDAVLSSLHIIGGQLFGLYEQNAHSL